MLPLQRRARSRDSAEPARGSFHRCDFFGHYRKAVERIWSKTRADRDIRRVATAGDQHPADARDVVPSVKGVPLAADIGFEPGCEIHRRVRGRHADIAQLAGAVSRRKVHAATEGDRQVSIVPANAGAIAECFPTRPAGTRVFVAKGDVLVDVVAASLDAAPAERRLPEQRPGDLGEPVGLAITGWPTGTPKPRRVAARRRAAAPRWPPHPARPCH